MFSLSEEYAMSRRDHATNLSSNLQDLLKQKQMVDVTLVADGVFVDAHRLVLSAVSPYFRQMFTQMPVNQQAFVFMKDVSKQTLERLITFIYCGEVNVGQGNVTEFLHMANELKIKGLADDSHGRSNDGFGSDFTSVNHNGVQSQFLGSHATDRTGSAAVFNGRQYQSTQTSRMHQQTNTDRTPASSEFGNFVDGYGTPNEVVPEYDEPTENYYDVNLEDLIEEKAGADLDGINGINSQNLFLGQQNIPRTDDFILNAPHDDGLNGIQSLKSVPKPTKRHKAVINHSGYNVIADVRKNSNGRDNLYFNSYKFYKNKIGIKKNSWCCTKNQSAKCKATVSTMEVNGTIMMKILVGQHTHEPSE